MPAEIRSKVTLTLGFSYGLAPPVYVFASWTKNPSEPMLMLVNGWQNGVPGEPEQWSFELKVDIPPGPCFYRYRLGGEDSGTFIIDHRVQHVEWNGALFNIIRLGYNPSGSQETGHSESSKNGDVGTLLAASGSESSPDTPGIEAATSSEGVFHFQHDSPETSQETIVHLRPSPEARPAQDTLALPGANTNCLNGSEAGNSSAQLPTDQASPSGKDAAEAIQEVNEPE